MIDSGRVSCCSVAQCSAYHLRRGVGHKMILSQRCGKEKTSPSRPSETQSQVREYSVR